MNWFIDLFRSPDLNNIDFDGKDRFKAHSYILSQKPLLKKVFNEFHQTFHRLDKKFLSGNGLRVEIGSGVAPIRDSYPDVLATDIVLGDHLDFALDAEKMNLPNSSVRVFFGQNCFHHFPHPRLFFDELDRVLIPGGGVILIEPYHGPVASFLFRRLFNTERFDKNDISWDNSFSGPMMGANQALSYIIFERDIAEFNKCYPRLQIIHHETCANYLMYLLSGGLNFRQIWPNWAIPLLYIFQKLLSPFDRWIALHKVIVLRKLI